MQSKEIKPWVGVLIFWIMGDLLTTYIGLQLGLIENGPVAQIVLNRGFEALIFFKLVFTSVMFMPYAYFRIKDKLFAIGIPVGLTLIGSFATLWNSYLILLVL